MSIRMAAGAATLALAAAMSTPLRATERIVFNCFFSPQHYACSQWAPELKRRIETVTEGRVMVSIPPKSLAAPPDQYEGVAGGVMDGAFQFNAFLAKQVPGIQFSLMPFAGALEAEYAGPAVWETYQKYFGDRNEYGDVVLISTMATPGSEIFSMTDQPILSVDDIRNRKMWGLPGVVANMMKDAGSAVVAGPAVQMLELISNGVVDGYAGVGWSSVSAFKLVAYTKSATLTKSKQLQPTFSAMISRAKWEKISPEDQDAIISVMGADFARFAGAVADATNVSGRAEAEAAGTKVFQASDEFESDLRALGEPIVADWVDWAAAQGVDGRAVLADYARAIEANRAAAAK